MIVEDKDLKNLFKDEDWYKLLYPFLKTEKFGRIVNTIRLEKEKGIKIFPKSSEIFRCFNETPLKSLRVVLCGADPYPQANSQGIPDACGLSFMVERDRLLPKSLQFIHKAIEQDVYNGLDLHNERTGDMLYLCRQGVLLLNSALTIQSMKSDSHAELWREFMEYTIDSLQAMTKSLIFIMWGKRAQSFERLINPLIHYTLKSSHPASAAYTNNIWQTDNFSKCNNIIRVNNLGEEIKW